MKREELLRKGLDVLGDARVILINKNPLIYSFIANLKIVATTKVFYTATDGETLYINPYSMEKLTPQEKVFLLSHEALHIMFRHLARSNREKDSLLWNIATDSVINHILLKQFTAGRLNREMVSMGDIRRISGMDMSKLIHMSSEEIYNILLEIRDKVEIRRSCFIYINLDENDVVIQQGRSDIYGETDENERERKWRNLLSEIYEKTRLLAGNEAGGLLRKIEEILGIPSRWDVILRRYISNVGREKTRTTYIRESRRVAGLPANIYTGYPRIWALIDTSGSISKNILTKFATEVVSIARKTEVYIVPFDAEAYGIYRARNMSEALTILNNYLHGGGGTKLSPALNKIIQRLRRNDIVLVLSDFILHDRDEAYKLLRKISSSGVNLILLTSAVYPEDVGNSLVIEVY